MWACSIGKGVGNPKPAVSRPLVRLDHPALQKGKAINTSGFCREVEVTNAVMGAQAYQVWWLKSDSEFSSKEDTFGLFLSDKEEKMVTNFPHYYMYI